MKLYIVDKFGLIKNNINDGTIHGFYSPCFRNMQELLDRNKYIKDLNPNSQIMMAKDSDIYLISPVGKVQTEYHNNTKYVSDFKIIKKLYSQDLINGYINSKNPQDNSELLDIIFECEDLWACDIKKLYRWMIDNHGLPSILSRPEIKDEMLLDIFNEIYSKYNDFINEEFLDIFASIIKNPNLTWITFRTMLKNFRNSTMTLVYIIKSLRIDIEMLDKIVDNLYEYGIWLTIIRSPKITPKLLKKMVSKIEGLFNLDKGNDIIFIRQYSYIIREIIKNPVSDNEIYKSILSIDCKGIESFWNSILLELSKKLDIDNDVIDMVLKKTQDDSIISLFIGEKEFTPEQIDKIFQISNENTILRLIKYNKLTVSQLKYILDKTNETNIISSLVYSPLIETLIEGLKQKLSIKTDINTFKKLYLLEDLKLSNQLESWSEDSEIPQLDYRKEKLKLLNKYLLCFNVLDIRAFILNEMCDLKYLKKEYLIDEEYNGKCPRSLKICSLVKHHKDEETKEV